MKKIKIMLVFAMLIFIILVFASYFNTNKMINSNNYTNIPQCLSSTMWWIRDVFFSCDTEVKLIRTIVYSMHPALDEKIEEAMVLPDFIGYPGLDVIYYLKKFGYDVTIKYISSGEYGENDVVNQIPSSGAIIMPGDKIEISVEDSWGNDSYNNYNGGAAGPFAVVQGMDVFYYDKNCNAIVKTGFDFEEKEIIYTGDVSCLNALGEYLYFYSYSRKAIIRYSITSSGVEELLKGEINQLRVNNNYFYFTDMNDDLKLKRARIGSYEQETLIDDFVTYFQIEGNMIYYFNIPGDKDNPNLGIQELHSMHILGDKVESPINELVQNFIVVGDVIYYTGNSRSYNGRLVSELIKIDLETGNTIRIAKGVTGFISGEEFQFLLFGTRFRDNRSLVGTIDLRSNNNELYYDCYSIGKKILIRLYSNEWIVFDGHFIEEIGAS